MFELAGRRALITGASGGIGGAIAAALHAQGAEVALSGTRIDALERVAAELGERAHCTPGDLSEASAAKALVERAEAAMGGLDVLVNNAGITRDALSLRMSDDDCQSVIDVNLTAAFRLSRAVLRGMLKQRWGRIVNVTSVVALTGNPGQANYAASKAGMIGMTKSLAHEVAVRGITVNCVAPGFIESPMSRALDDERRARILDTIPAGRLGEGLEVAACVVFLASDDAAYITGQTLHVNGGMAMP